MRLTVLHPSKARVFTLHDDEPYLVVRGRDPYMLRSLGAILDVLEENKITSGKDFNDLCGAVIEWQKQHRDLVKFEIDYQDLEIIHDQRDE